MVHGKASLVAAGGALGRLLPLVYSQTVVRPEMIRTVDLGPFKHKVGHQAGAGAPQSRSQLLFLTPKLWLGLRAPTTAFFARQGAGL